MPILQNSGSCQTIGPSTDSLTEIKALAEAVLGGRAEAQDWLNKSALALDGLKPIALMATASGFELADID